VQKKQCSFYNKAAIAKAALLFLYKRLSGANL
jgi:hypothetical protein